MSFKDFTYADIHEKLGLVVRRRPLFTGTPELAPSSWLIETLLRTADLGLTLSNEKARSELLIAPILVEVWKGLSSDVSLFSGVELTGDASKGLSGVCDFVLSRSPEQFMLSAPIIAIVEAKREDINGGLGQCAAEMVAARLFNEREGHAIPVAYGTVTAGDEWKFLSLTDGTLEIDTDMYYLPQMPKILGIFRQLLA
jgi:hypothetical protein